MSNIRVLISKNGLIELKVPQQLMSKVKGLCGNYNDDKNDDYVNRRNQVLLSTKQFYNAWKIYGYPDCDQVIGAEADKEVKDKAYKICNMIRFPPFQNCHSLISTTEYLSTCLPSTMECLKQNENDERKCRCKSMENYVSLCLRKNPRISFDNWRNTHLCRKYQVNILVDISCCKFDSC